MAFRCNSPHLSFFFLAYLIYNFEMIVLVSHIHLSLSLFVKRVMDTNIQEVKHMIDVDITS